MNLSRLKMCSKKRLGSRESGIALLSVLWALLLLSALAGAAAFMARGNSILTHRLGDIAQAEAVADAAIINAISKLSDEMPARHPIVDGQSRPWDFQAFQATVSISKDAGRIDVNAADDDLILAFLYSQRVGEDTAKTLVKDLRGLQHTAYGSTQAGLRTIEELRQIPSWKTQPLDCWMDSFTVYTGQRGVSANDAAGKIEEALKWAQDHYAGGRDWATTQIAAPSALSARSVLGEVLRIDARVTLAPNISASSEWVGRLTGNKHQPTLTLRWSHETFVPSSHGCEKL
jgi:hypothetical protein